MPITYGGCETNRAVGIAGHNKLTSEKNRIITDKGLADDCVLIPPLNNG
jgi:hypothetical protein